MVDVEGEGLISKEQEEDSGCSMSLVPLAQ